MGDYQPLTRLAVGQGGAAVTSESWEYTGAGRGRYQQVETVVETYGQVGDPPAECAADDPECPLLPVKETDGEFQVSIARSSFDEPLGIFVHESEVEHALEVLRVATGLGPVQRWNADHPSRKVQRGDRIVAVNGVSGDGPRLREEIERQGAPDLVLAVRRRRKRGTAAILWCLKSSCCVLLVLLFTGLALWMEASQLPAESCGRLSGLLGVGLPCQAEDEPEPAAAVAGSMLGAGRPTATTTATTTATETAPTSRTSTVTSISSSTTTAASSNRTTARPRGTSCVELGADYSPSMGKPRYFPHASTAQQHRQYVIACLKLCANTAGCAHFTYEIVDGSCRMAKATATLTRGVPLTVSGPPRCSREESTEAESERSLLLTEEANWELLR